MSDSPQSPPKDVDHGAQSPDEEGQMNETQDTQSLGLASYEFEGVKEQDRWLPIANGKSPPPFEPGRDLPSTPVFSYISLACPSGASHGSRFVNQPGRGLSRPQARQDR